MAAAGTPAVNSTANIHRVHANSTTIQLEVAPVAANTAGGQASSRQQQDAALPWWTAGTATIAGPRGATSPPPAAGWAGTHRLEAPQSFWQGGAPADADLAHAVHYAATGSNITATPSTAVSAAEDSGSGDADASTHSRQHQGSKRSSRGSKGSGAETLKLRGRSGPKSRFSPFIGVSQYKRTGRWEAHIWDSSSSTRGSTVSSSKGGKGKQLHLGSFLTAAQAARAYDRAALLLRGPTAALNYPLDEYATDPVLEELSRMSRQDMILALRKTCDIELEAAALEAFHAKVPAAAAHLLHNITGPATGVGQAQPGSMHSMGPVAALADMSDAASWQQCSGQSDIVAAAAVNQAQLQQWQQWQHQHHLHIQEQQQIDEQNQGLQLQQPYSLQMHHMASTGNGLQHLNGGQQVIRIRQEVVGGSQQQHVQLQQPPQQQSQQQQLWLHGQQEHQQRQWQENPQQIGQQQTQQQHWQPHQQQGNQGLSGMPLSPSAAATPRATPTATTVSRKSRSPLAAMPMPHAAAFPSATPAAEMQFSNSASPANHAPAQHKSVAAIAGAAASAQHLQPCSSLSHQGLVLAAAQLPYPAVAAAVQAQHGHAAAKQGFGKVAAGAAAAAAAASYGSHKQDAVEEDTSISTSGDDSSGTSINDTDQQQLLPTMAALRQQGHGLLQQLGTGRPHHPSVRPEQSGQKHRPHTPKQQQHEQQLHGLQWGQQQQQQLQQPGGWWQQQQEQVWQQHPQQDLSHAAATAGRPSSGRVSSPASCSTQGNAALQGWSSPQLHLLSAQQQQPSGSILAVQHVSSSHHTATIVVAGTRQLLFQEHGQQPLAMQQQQQQQTASPAVYLGSSMTSPATVAKKDSTHSSSTVAYAAYTPVPAATTQVQAGPSTTAQAKAKGQSTNTAATAGLFPWHSSHQLFHGARQINKPTVSYESNLHGPHVADSTSNPGLTNRSNRMSETYLGVADESARLPAAKRPRPPAPTSCPGSVVAACPSAGQEDGSSPASNRPGPIVASQSPVLVAAVGADGTSNAVAVSPTLVANQAVGAAVLNSDGLAWWEMMQD